MKSDAVARAVESLPAILSIKEIMVFFQVSYQTVYRLVINKQLPAYKDDENNWCILRPDLKKFCSKNCNL